MPSARRQGNAFVSFCSCTPTTLQRRGVGFAGADSDRLLKVEYEDLAVADLARLGGGRDGFDGLFGLIGRDRDLDLQFGQETHGILGAAIDFSVALLAPIALDLRYGHTVHADGRERVADLVELE